jgi:hypothetical protein
VRRALPALVLTAVLTCLALGGAGAAVPPAGAGPAGLAGRAAVVQSDPADDPAGDPADDPDGDPATEDAPLPGGDIIPQPDSGREPTDAGDRGGALQVALFFVLVAGVATIGGLAVRDVRKAQRRRVAAASQDRPARR